MIVKLLSGQSEYTDLSEGQLYSVIGIEADDYRILNDQGRPFLYPHVDFEVVDDREPEDWHSEIGEDSERYAYPAALNASGFFEDFFDGKLEAVTIFWQIVNQRLARASTAA